MKSAIVLLADGFEEIEASTVIDILRRGNIQTTTVSTGRERQVCGSHGITLLADSFLSHELENDFDVIVLPGGQPGSNNLKSNPEVERFLKKERTGCLMAAICAAPTVFASAGILGSHKITSYPTDKDVFDARYYLDEVTVYDPPFLTSRGVGTAIAFSLKIVELLVGENTARNVGRKILFYE